MAWTVTTHLIGNIREFMKHFFWYEVTIEEDGLSSREREDAEMGMSKSQTSRWTLLSLRRMFITVEERCSRTYLTDSLGSLSDCYVR